MLRHWPSLLCCLTLLLGCASKPASQSNEDLTLDQLKGRLDAALSMSNLNQRDEALKAVAENAASAGQAELVKQALGKFTNLNVKDEVAAACALKLSAAGHAQEGVEVAKMMTNINMRDEALRKIAQGKP